VRTTILILVMLLAVFVVGSAMAVMPGKSVEYPDGDQGKVIFSGDTHGMKQGMKCPDCHPKIFMMKKGMFKMTKEDHGNPSKGCGVCHNGEKAFSQSNQADCIKCHKKTETKEEIKEEAPAKAPAAIEEEQEPAEQEPAEQEEPLE
jgi:c(7)-type cytochrome triheme protein